MKYSIEIGKIVEGPLKHDQAKVVNYTKQLISKLEEDNETRAANKFSKLLSVQNVFAFLLQVHLLSYKLHQEVSVLHLLSLFLLPKV